MKVLVVDDSRATRFILRKTLAELGFEVCEAASGDEALTLLPSLSGQLSLVLVDWNMPGISGLEFIKQARQRGPTATVAMVMVTTETDIDHIVAALDAGANEYVMKPFTKDILSDKLRMLGLLN